MLARTSSSVSRSRTRARLSLPSSSVSLPARSLFPRLHQLSPAIPRQSSLAMSTFKQVRAITRSPPYHRALMILCMRRSHTSEQPLQLFLSATNASPSRPPTRLLVYVFFYECSSAAANVLPASRDLLRSPMRYISPSSHRSAHSSSNAGSLCQCAPLDVSCLGGLHPGLWRLHPYAQGAAFHPGRPAVHNRGLWYAWLGSGTCPLGSRNDLSDGAEAGPVVRSLPTLLSRARTRLSSIAVTSVIVSPTGECGYARRSSPKSISALVCAPTARRSTRSLHRLAMLWRSRTSRLR